jgi:hypothetical protein
LAALIRGGIRQLLAAEIGPENDELPPDKRSATRDGLHEALIGKNLDSSTYCPHGEPRFLGQFHDRWQHGRNLTRLDPSPQQRR